MKNIVKNRAFMIIFVLVMTMTSCGNNAEKNVRNQEAAIVNETVTEVPSESEALEDNTQSQVQDLENADNIEDDNSQDESDYYPITFTDMDNRLVTIEKEPEKIVSPYYISTSMIIALDLEDKMVGIEDKPEIRPLYNMCAEQLKSLPTVGSLKNFDIEKCVSLEPDVVFLPMKLRDIADNLEELGITVVMINPESQQLLEQSLYMIARATNKMDRCEEIVTYINDIENDLRNHEAESQAPSVYLGGNSSFFLTAGNAMYQSDLITMAGGKSVSDEIDDTYWVESSYEQILAWDPEYIFLASAAEYTVDDILGDKNLAECTAVKNQNVYHIPSDIEAWDSPVPSGILGSVWIAHVLYPDYMTDEKYDSIVQEFYEKFYDFKCE